MRPLDAALAGSALATVLVAGCFSSSSGGSASPGFDACAGIGNSACDYASAVDYATTASYAGGTLTLNGMPSTGDLDFKTFVQ